MFCKCLRWEPWLQTLLMCFEQLTRAQVMRFGNQLLALLWILTAFITFAPPAENSSCIPSTQQKYENMRATFACIDISWTEQRLFSKSLSVGRTWSEMRQIVLNWLKCVYLLCFLLPISLTLAYITIPSIYINTTAQNKTLCNQNLGSHSSIQILFVLESSHWFNCQIQGSPYSRFKYKKWSIIISHSMVSCDAIQRVSDSVIHAQGTHMLSMWCIKDASWDSVSSVLFMSPLSPQRDLSLTSERLWVFSFDSLK